MFSGVFGDHFAHRDNFLTGIDARIKIVFVFGAITAMLFSRAPYPPLIAALLSVIFLKRAGIPAKIILLRLAGPLTIAAVIALIEIFFYGGPSRGFLMIGRVTGCAALIVFLSMTTPVSAFLRAASWFRVPKTWLEVTAVSYRYVFVLLEDALTIRDAQKVRLGYKNLSTSLRSSVELIGSVLIRAYDRAISSYEAMRLRGYSGNAMISFEKKFNFRDGLHVVVFAVILSVLVILNLYWR